MVSKEILDAHSSLGGEGSPKAIQEELGPGNRHCAIKQLVWRIAEMWLLVAAAGKYRRNEAVPATNDGAVQRRVTGVTAVTPVTAVTYETEEKGNPVTDEIDGTERDGNTVTRVTAVTVVTRLATKHTQGQAAAGLIRVSKRIESEALAQVMIHPHRSSLRTLESGSGRVGSNRLFHEPGHTEARTQHCQRVLE
jgi:hypothetical protein